MIYHIEIVNFKEYLNWYILYTIKDILYKIQIGTHGP